MKNSVLSVACAVSALTLCGSEIALPAPQKSGGMTLAEALNTRHTVREFTSREVTVQELANVLWGANGVTRPNGKRTAPSAMNRQEITIYVTMKTGTFLYDAAAHKLVKVSDQDLRRYAGEYQAPVYLILVADAEKQFSEQFAFVDTGYVSQNIYLAATAQSLGTCAIGSIVDREKLAAVLNLGKSRPMLAHPLGTPENK